MKIKFKIRLAMALRAFFDPYSYEKNRANAEVTDAEVERALDEAITYGKVRVYLPTNMISLKEQNEMFEQWRAEEKYKIREHLIHQRACEAIGATP